MDEILRFEDEQGKELKEMLDMRGTLKRDRKR